AVAADLTGDSLSSYLDEFEEYSLQTTASIVRNIGLELEVYLTLQYESYLPAINALPNILPELELVDFVEAGSIAFEHFAVLSNHSALNDIYYNGGATIVSETFSSIAYQYEFVHDGDIQTAMTDFDEDLSEIKVHLNAIADAWDAAADALEQALAGPGIPWIPSMTGIGAIFILTVAIVTRRRRESRI
ncbi:MAG: hypothetical protein ACFFEV_05815, partial [Candidatus Thorarchaeota archaeon]